MSKEKVDRIPVWIRLKGLDIKYWGNNALTKISGMIEKPLKADRATTNKERLAFARVLVEVSVNQKYPTQVMFENEMGKIVKQEVYYEWKTTLCPKCKILDMNCKIVGNCTKKKQKSEGSKLKRRNKQGRGPLKQWDITKEKT